MRKKANQLLIIAKSLTIIRDVRLVKVPQTNVKCHFASYTVGSHIHTKHSIAYNANEIPKKSLEGQPWSAEKRVYGLQQYENQLHCAGL